MPNICFIHGRPGPHPFHGLLAEAVGADFVFVDYKMRWHDRDSSKFYRYLSQAVCGALLPSQYDIVISEGPHSVPIIARMTRLFGAKPTAVALMDNETFYFLKTGYYSPRTAAILKKVLSRFDALVCVGEYQYNLANELLNTNIKKDCVKLFKIHSSLKTERINKFVKISPEILGNNLLFIGNGPSGWRAYYKGLDVLIESLELIIKQKPEISLTIVGEWDETYINELLSPRPELKHVVNFAGKTTDLEPFLKTSSLYVHPARGEAFGISIIEAMAAGLPCIVSNETGAKEAVVQVSNEWVVDVDPRKLADKILDFYELPDDEKKRLSDESRAIAIQYTEERAIKEFRNAIQTIAIQ